MKPSIYGVGASSSCEGVCSLADYVEFNAALYARNPALEYHGWKLTYAELNKVANQCANMLLSLGVRKGDAIAICLPNSPQYLVAIIAASKVGATVVGVSPLLPRAEIVRQINFIKVNSLLILDGYLEDLFLDNADELCDVENIFVFSIHECLPAYKRFFQRRGHVRKFAYSSQIAGRVLAGWRKILSSSDDAINLRQSNETTVFVQFTGGTTGKPKAVELSLGGIHGKVLKLKDIFGFKPGEESVVSAFSYSHTAGVMLAALCFQQAAKLVIIPDVWDIESYCLTVKKSSPTVLVNVYTFYQVLVQHPAFKKICLDSLKLAVSGGGSLPFDAVERFESVAGKHKLLEVYGMTEAYGVVAYNSLGSDNVGSVVVPMSDVSVKIVDLESGDNELAIGDVGEIIVSGTPQVACYLNDPASNLDSFRSLAGRKWIYSGDVGFVDADNAICVFGRKEDIVKVNGHIVSSSELENLLATLGCIELCAVLSLPDPIKGREVIKLFVQLHPNYNGIDLDGIRRDIAKFCRRSLPLHLIPQEIYFNEALPLTPAGKIDKRAIRVKFGSSEQENIPR